jgi:hypothetical protein
VGLVLVVDSKGFRTSQQETMEESEWIILMVVKKMKKGGIWISVDMRKPNYAFLHDSFPTQFTDEVLENVGGHKDYSFIDGFSGYHDVRIAPEDRHKITFSTEWGSFQYTVMPIGLKNAPASFSMVVVSSFKEFIHNVLEV